VESITTLITAEHPTVGTVVISLDWTLDDVVIVPVAALPDEVAPSPRRMTGQSAAEPS